MEQDGEIGADDSVVKKQYPVNIMNLASVRDVESKIRKDVDLQTLSPRRFRANIFSMSSSFLLLPRYPSLTLLHSNRPTSL